MIQAFNISGFRGIKNLNVQGLNQVNLIVGDNNSGKTSVLEALQLLSNPIEVSNLYRVARYRDTIFISNGISLYESVRCLFPQSNENLSLELSAQIDGVNYQYQIEAEQKRIMIEASEMDEATLRHSEIIVGNEAEQIEGTIFYEFGSKKGETPFKINTFSKLSGLALNKNLCVRMAYVAPFDHLQGSIINLIIRNEGYKEICIKALQLFDPDIEDILILKSNIGVRIVDYVKHKKLGLMPLSTFGDGIKKVLMLANKIAQATNGVLLIDEVETSIHKKYYDDIFQFIVKASKAFNVQVFITTHSIEAIDGLLSTQRYENQQDSDDISVVTLKKVNDLSYSRVLSGREVAENRESFGFEVRL